MRHRAVIFDLDDTLLRAIETYWDHHKAVCREVYGFELSDDELRLHWGKPFRTFLPAIYRNSDTYENMLIAERSLASRFPVSLFDDALDSVMSLVNNGIAVGVLTSADRALVVDDLIKFGFPVEQFVFVQTSEDTDVHKPDPDVFLPSIRMLKSHGISVSETLYVGDHINDFLAARDASIEFLAVTTGLTTASEFTDAGAQNVVARLSEWFCK